MNNDAYVFDAIRTPRGKKDGALNELTPTDILAKLLKSLQKKHNLNPDAIWSVGSSGSLNRSLQIAFSDAEANVVQVGHKMSEREIGRAKLYIAPYKYDKAVKKDEAPPFPSAPEYDAKGWKVMLDNMNHNKLNLFYNVAR